ncbi:SPOR domain-containing protein [Dokdonia genika]|uniref:Sporulation/cell-division related protein n=2 Tax=Dokdonia TaxID=326319 RepID=H6RFB0_9FLAO|nr:sporulation protein [uncultured bacterium]CCF99721.1 sporulation/cell-division related protein [uncultured Dokdonia sp.]
MQLDQYISDLLYRYECVILPGFGAFLTQIQSAQIHATTHAFYPPKKKLSFNAQLTDSDGLLANYIAKTEMIPHSEASNRIKTYVRFLYDNLHKGESQTLTNIGTLSLDTESRLQFEPSYHLNYLTDSFGLSSFTSPEIMREVYKEEVTALEETTPIAFTPERKASNSWLKYAAAAVIAFGVLGAASFNYVQDVKEHNYVAQEQAREQLEDKIQEATFVIPNPLPAIQLSLTKPAGNYHIVAGAFRMEENAQKRVDQLTEKGYKARTIGTNKYGLHQVIYGSFTDSQEALSELRAIRKTDNQDAWLLVQSID